MSVPRFPFPVPFHQILTPYLNAQQLKLVAIRRSQQPISRRFNIIIYTEYDSAIALS
ncbi:MULTISPECIES: hypothetical protein [unclassified Microcoleus]|uniref:hypothetical protein n=1 Tax=unclassified Microcoleus TaxID=2642155 RepID=UPI002FD6D340